MAENLSVQGPVDIRSDCKQRVAFDLMDRIARYEKNDRIVKDETYWLTLYTKCLKAANGYSLSSSQKVE